MNKKILLASGGSLIRPFAQPVVSSNSTLGGTIFAVNGATNAYLAFDNNSNTSAASSGGVYLDLKAYNPNPIKVSQVGIRTAAYQQSGGYSLYSGTIQVSDDGNSWSVIASWSSNPTGNGGILTVPIPEANRIFKKYIRVNGMTNNGYGSGCAEIYLTAEEIV